MSDSASNRRGSFNWPEISAIILSLAAILVSGIALFEGRQEHQDERNTEILDAVYDDWMNLAMQTDWRVQHVLEAPDTYYEYRDLARNLTIDMTPHEKAQAFLMEHSMANLIFTQFEHHHKQWMIAVNSGDTSRQDVLQEEMDFYASGFLRNPRLLWFWSPDGGGWVNGADPSSVSWYRENVLENPADPLNETPDAEGILPGFDWKDVNSR